MTQPQYDGKYVRELFDRMGWTYDLVNLVSSFGFSAFWRWQCVSCLSIPAGASVCDMMAGSGECWSSILRLAPASVTSIDFSPVMADRQRRRCALANLPVEVHCENAVSTSIPPTSMDFVVSAFGLKTLDAGAVRRFGSEIRRILKVGGQFSLIEISFPEDWVFAPLYRRYVMSVIPLIGKLCLGDIECYRMLGVYTAAFGSCSAVAPIFRELGLEVSVKSHFFGCATSLVGRKLN